MFLATEMSNERCFLFPPGRPTCEAQEAHRRHRATSALHMTQRTPGWAGQGQRGETPTSRPVSIRVRSSLKGRQAHFCHSLGLAD
eukprot:scaffold403622_cov24-Prasinocladus_malaysianus.AAC.1